MKKLLALLACLVFVLSILPLSAFATPTGVDSDSVYINVPGGDASIRDYSKIYGFTENSGGGGTCWVQCEVKVVHGTNDKAVSTVKSNISVGLFASLGANCYYTDDETGNENIYTGGQTREIPIAGFSVTSTAPNAYAYKGVGAFIVEFELYGDWIGATTDVV